MSARPPHRGGFNPPLQPGYPRTHDARGYAHSSGHVTPGSSYHGSPLGQSPYGGSGQSWNGQQPQFSPQSQYQAPYSHNSSYGAPTGPQGHYHTNQAHSPQYPPSGPASQYPQGPYRGGHRGGSGGSGGFRGGQFGAARGGHRGTFKNAQWNSNAPSSSNGRGQPGPGEDGDPSHTSNHASPDKHTDSFQEPEDVSMGDGDNPFRPSKDLQVEDTRRDEQHNEDEMPPPNRPPPSGSQSQTPNKFSFSMKNAAKPVAAAPRVEITSKLFSAALSREPPPKASEKTPPQKATSSRSDRGDRDRSGSGLPKNVPTEPASARARPIERRPAEQNRQPESTPRTRKVKKIMKRRKERPTLELEMSKSKSVYFRKPGNESVIGSGTYGKVFKGLNVYTRNLVALKRIRMEGERDGFPVTAVREIKLLRSLKHENIVKLQEVMVESNECFMVFEYLAHDLTGLLNHPDFTLEAAHKKHLARQLFEGLDYLHTRGVLHRDIKAANILVSNEGILKIADFGLARFYAKHHQVDYTNRVITIWYRSPELLLGETQYGPAVDIWSAACVMVEIFTKRAIFPGDGSEISQLEKIHATLGTPNRKDWPNLTEMPWFELLRPDYRRPSVFKEKYKDHVPPAAFELLAAMFQYDPAKRPSAAEVLQHPYFTVEEPAPRQAIELKDIAGEWHEFESKALRRENERKEKKEKDARRATKEAAAVSARDSKDRKRPSEAKDTHREPKRPHVDSESRSDNADRDLELESATAKNQRVFAENRDTQPKATQPPQPSGRHGEQQTSNSERILSGSTVVAPEAQAAVQQQAAS
ncbi:kinase-like domain-containing protein [Podospora appendiculata]|uniref:cyclin-dependent kinase n=1 Tax=Podospora appendiculata TaxID=314037 RepID=A0AAE0X4L6_9PEZI|nr:kinase-like domain-containing protein [Podospora appendiculata]